MLELSTESNNRFTARDIHARMSRIAPIMVQADEFDAALMSNAKKDLLTEHPEIKFIAKNSYRLTEASCAQLGQMKKNRIRKNARNHQKNTGFPG